MKLIEQIDIQTQDIKWLYDLYEKGLLAIDDSYQRNFVWSSKHQVKLMESILIGYPVPEIYLFNTGTDENTGDTTYAIIDGQQRCTSIFQFIENSFKLNEKQLSVDTDNFDNIKNRKFKELESDDKKAIWSYKFSVRLVRNSVKHEKIVNMFLRLNSNNMTLNPQELRNAEFEGEFMNLSSDLAALDFWKKNMLFSLSDIRRMKDVSEVSILLVFMKKGIEEDISSRNLNQIYDLYNDSYPNKEQDEERFIFILNEIDKIIDMQKNRTNILKKQVHFYTLFTVIYNLTTEQVPLDSEYIQNYQYFLDNFNDTVTLASRFDIEHVKMYKTLVKEGTRQKSNRFDRFKIIKEFITVKSQSDKNTPL
jgi:hypothetical protein